LILALAGPFAGAPTADPGSAIRFAAAGDVMLSRGVADRMREDGMDAPFSGLAPLLREHDLAFCNLDFTISDRGRPRGGGYGFRCRPDSAAGLVASGFNLFSLANYHVTDFGPEAMLDTRVFLESRGFHCAGAAANAWEALEPAVVERNGLRVALLAFREAPFRARKPRNPQVASPDSQALFDAIAAARRVADVVLVSWHWGEENRHDPTAYQARYGRLSVDAGADLVLGHHPHALQAIERYKGRYIFHSLGNAVHDQAWQAASESVLLSCRLSKGKVSEVALRPLIIRGGRPEPASGKDFRRIAAKLGRYCAGTGVRLTGTDSTLRVE
jgi:poly-gamma-glutamate synthesis protein (capsule biosynthesis protein)